MVFRQLFNPSPQESARRRLKVFGTENKAVVGGVIVGTAALAAAAPVLVTGAGLRSAGAAVARTAAANPLKATVAGFFAPAAIVAVARNPAVVTKTGAGLVNLQSNLIQTAANPTKENITAIGRENPILAGVLGAATLGAAGVSAGAVFGAVGNERNRRATERNTDAVLSSTSDSPNNLRTNQIIPTEASGNNTGPLIPVTNQTQVVGKEPTLAAKRKRKTKKIMAAPVVRNTVRVNVLNQNKYIAARNFR